MAPKITSKKLKTAAATVMISAATLAGTAGLTSCSKDNGLQEQTQNLSYTITDAQSLGKTLDKIAADLNRIASPAYNKGERIDVSLSIKINDGALRFVYSEDLMKLAAMLQGDSGVLTVDKEQGIARRIIDFYGIENLLVNITGDKNATIYPDVMNKNGNHIVPDYEFEAAYNRSVYLLKRAGLNVVEKPGQEIAMVNMGNPKGKTLRLTPEMFIEMKNKESRA
ncbi:MAG: hypothetical protein LBD50_03805 [Rickettsiales bacterium]|jgi:hypothetical protein|nr:hypothetical protein [Rickettsiales bacterium]